MRRKRRPNDIGRLEANGNLYRLDRADDMVISGELPPCAVVCVKAEASVTEKELIELCSVHLGNYKRPGKVVLRRDPLPKTPVGKIKRKELREPFWVGRERRVAGN